MPAGLQAILNEAALADKFDTVIVEITAEFDAGTVYNVVGVLGAGFDCPKIFKICGIYYAPINMNVFIYDVFA